jgi:excisionase family DNA binding protein
MGRTETNSVDSNSPRDFVKPLWVSPRRASRVTGIGITRLYELLNEGRIKSTKIGRKRLISYASLEALGEPARD